jgi:hypothetical protein
MNTEVPPSVSFETQVVIGFAISVVLQCFSVAPSSAAVHFM